MENEKELEQWYERDRESKKKWRDNNKEEINKKAREKYILDRERRNKRQRELYQLQKEKDKKHEYYEKNKEHILELRRKQRSRTKNNHLIKRYGITLETYEKMVSLQNSKCYICETYVENTKNNYLHVDHNHTTGEVRKLLCMSCNASLGLIKESTDTLQKMIVYLEEHNGKQSHKTA
jgi:hypothetical protein